MDKHQMSIEKINLRKALQLFYADRPLRRSLLLADIRTDRYKAAGNNGNGGDFYGPFWSDVKDHAAGLTDLSETTAARIAANPARGRLYPLLRDASFKPENLGGEIEKFHRRKLLI